MLMEEENSFLYQKLFISMLDQDLNRATSVLLIKFIYC